MNNSDKKTAVVPVSVSRKTRRRFLLLALLAVLGAGALFHGIVAPLASAAPRFAPPSDTTTPTPQQSVPLHAANADADVGPGQCELVLVGSP